MTKLNIKTAEEVYPYMKDQLVEESEVLTYGINQKYLEKLSKFKCFGKLYYYKCQFENKKLKKNLREVIKFLDKKGLTTELYVKEFAMKMDKKSTKKHIEGLYYRIVNPYGDYF